MGEPACNLWKTAFGTSSCTLKVNSYYLHHTQNQELRLLYDPRLAGMIARVETSQGWLEQITYNMNHMVRVD